MTNDTYSNQIGPADGMLPTTQLRGAWLRSPAMVAR